MFEREEEQQEQQEQQQEQAVAGGGARRQLCHETYTTPLTPPVNLQQQREIKQQVEEQVGALLHMAHVLRLQPLIDELMGTLDSTADQTDATFLSDAVKRAEGLEKDGKAAEARPIWQGIITLYADDPAAQDQVSRARTAISQEPPQADLSAN